MFPLFLLRELNAILHLAIGGLLHWKGFRGVVPASCDRLISASARSLASTCLRKSIGILSVRK